MTSFLTLAALLSSYSCEIQPPHSVFGTGSEAKIIPVALPLKYANIGKFTITVNSAKKGELPLAKVDWTDDPINVAGEYPAIPSGAGAFTLMAYSPGPCLFTEQACATTIQIADQKVGPSKLMILPAALTTDFQSQTREPFVVFIEGQCTKGAGK